MSSTFYIPDTDSYTTEQVIKKSRFIANLKYVSSKAEAIEFVEQIKEKYKDARHNCWGYLVGDPDSPSAIGYSDDGEPKGTAGPPILGVLQKKAVSMTIIVVTRYFGGVKLGAAGLVRAYSGTAVKALDEIPIKLFAKVTELRLSTSYLYINTILNYFAQQNVTVLDSQYTENVTLLFEVNEELVDSIKEQISEITKGSGNLEPI